MTGKCVHDVLEYFQPIRGLFPASLAVEDENVAEFILSGDKDPLFPADARQGSRRRKEAFLDVRVRNLPDLHPIG